MTLRKSAQAFARQIEDAIAGVRIRAAQITDQIPGTAVAPAQNGTRGTIDRNDIPSAFTDLSDVPASYSGQGSKLVAVKSDASGLEFVTGSGGAVDSVNGQTGTVVLDAGDVGAEPALGNPSTNGYVLASTTGGVRSWVAQSGGGGGGATIGSGADASRPAAGTAGDLYLPTDAPYLYRDTGSAWQAWGPLRKLTQPPTSGWSWVNQGSAVLTDLGGGAFSIYDPATGGVNYRARVRTAPSTPYTITACLDMILPTTGEPMAGLLWRNSGNGKLVSARVDYSSGYHRWYGIKADSATNEVAAFGGNYIPLARPMWIRLADDGTNRTMSISFDGTYFVRANVTSRTDHITPDEVGVFVCSRGSADAAVTLLSWEET